MDGPSTATAGPVHLGRLPGCMRASGAGPVQSAGAPDRAWTTPSPNRSSPSLKVELVNRNCFATRAEARRAIFAWIVRYDRRRLIPPIEWEQRHGHTLQLPSTVAA
jgi:putative transposase